MDPSASFEHIVENVPSWKSQLIDLSTHAIKKHDEYVAEYSRLLHRVKAKRAKSASLASLRTTDKDERAEIPSPTPAPLKSPQPSELVEISPLEAGNRFIYAQAHRKRKPGTSLRSNASGPRNFRSKQMVVVYYDSHIQSELDKLVKGFGAARNNLRKGKNAYNMTKGFTLPGLSKRYEAADNLVYNPTTKSGPRLPKTQSDPVVSTATNDISGESSFQRADKELEVIQSLCEHAAHQVIRDGDCNLELKDAAGKLDSLLALAQSALDLFKAENIGRDDDVHAADRGSVSDGTSTQSTLCETPSFEGLGMQAKILPPLLESTDHVKRPPLPTTVSAPPDLVATDTIEVDDDEDGDEDNESMDIDLDMSRFRTAGRPRVIA